MIARADPGPPTHRRAKPAPLVQPIEIPTDLLPDARPPSGRPVKLLFVWIQRFLKGIPDLSDGAAEEILESGLMCRWWQRVGEITPGGIREKLTEDALHAHLEDYASVKDETPFISLTAGVRMRSTRARGYGRNVVVKAQRTAVMYATDGFKRNGYIFAGYVFVMPNPSVPFEGFAEDVRDLQRYSRYRRFHRQGEVTAKIIVPSVQLEYAQPCAPAGGGTLGIPVSNRNYEPPDAHLNLRDVL